MTERAVIEYILNALWQIPLLAGGAWGVLKITRPKPQVQHAVWLAALGLAVLMPVHGIAPGGPALAGPQRDNLIRSVATQPSVVATRVALPRTHGVHIGETTTHWVVRLYLATVILGVFRIVHSWISSRLLVRRSREILFEGQMLAEFERYGRMFEIRLPRLRQSAEVSSPMIMGANTTILLLPEGFTEFTAEERRAAVCHEFAHVQRRDYVSNLICQLAALPVAWHPVVIAMQHQIRLTRELVCDAIAANAMETRAGYARCLLAMARSLTVRPDLAGHSQFIKLFGNHSLEERVMRLMDTTITSLRVKTARVACGMAVAVLTAMIAATFHVIPTMAQQTAQAPAQAAPVTPPAGTTTLDDPSISAASIPAGPPASNATSADADQDSTKSRSEEDAKHAMESAARHRAAARAIVESPEFKRELKKIQAQAAKANELINSPEFKRQMETVQRQAELAAKSADSIDTPEFKRQIEAAQSEMRQETLFLESPEFKHQMETVERQAREAARAVKFLQTPEFKRQIEEAKQAVTEAQIIHSEEFKRQMEEVERHAAEVDKEFRSDDHSR